MTQNCWRRCPRLHVAVVLALGIATGSVLAQATNPASGLTELVQQFRSGDADRAVSTLRQWNRSRVEAEVAALSRSDDVWFSAATALLLTEAAFQNRSFDEYENGVGGRPEISTRTAFSIVDDLRDRAQSDRNGRLWDFVRTWMGYVNSWHYRFGLRSRFLSFDEPKLKGDAYLQLLRGATLEQDMGPYIRGGKLSGFVPEGYEMLVTTMDRAGFNRAVGFIETSHGLFFPNTVRDAELFLRRAIALSPEVAEAHLRLGRLLYRVDRNSEAQAEFERALSDSRRSKDQATEYVAALLLGQLHERAGRASEAEKSYRAAVSVGVSGYTAPLSLGTLQVATGRFDEGWQTIRSVFDNANSLPIGAIDPWLGYQAFQYWSMPKLSSKLRALVRGEPVPDGISAPSKSADPFLPLSTLNTQVVEAALPQGRFRAITDGVRVDVRVVGENGHPVQGLSANDFVVTDSGHIEKIDLVQVPARLAVALLLDTTASARKGRSELVSAAEQFLRALDPTDVVSFMTFSDRFELVAAPTAPRNVRPLLTPRDEPWTRTTMHDAVMAGASLVAQEYGFPVVLVLGDAAENNSFLDARTVTNALSRAGVIVDAVWSTKMIVGDKVDVTFGVMPYEVYTKQTGGMTFDAASPNLDQQLWDRVREIRSSYVITYTPSDPRDGWHDLKVKLKGRKGEVRTRSGYFSGPSVMRRR